MNSSGNPARESTRPGKRLSTPGSRRRLRGPLLVGAAVVAIAVAAVVLAQSPKPPGEHSPTAGEPSRSPSSSPAEQPVTGPDASGQRDFEAIYRELEAVRLRAYREHKPELLDDVYSDHCTPGCTVKAEKQAIADEAAAGTYSNANARILKVDVLEQRTDMRWEETNRSVTIRVIDEQPPYTVTARDGTVVTEAPGWPPTSRVFDLHYSPGRGRWLIWNYAKEGSGEPFLLGSPEAPKGGE